MHLTIGINYANNFRYLLAQAYFLGGCCRSEDVDCSVNLILLFGQVDLGGVGWASVVLAELPLLEASHGNGKNKLEASPPKKQKGEACSHME